jgi:hypothetical protein
MRTAVVSVTVVYGPRNRAKYTETGQQICNQGHLLTPENTYVNPKGFNVCKTCKTASFVKHKKMIAEREKRREKILQGG